MPTVMIVDDDPDVLATLGNILHGDGYKILQANNGIEFTLREEFSGLLLPLIAGSIPNQTQTFEDFAAGLKAFAEKA